MNFINFIIGINVFLLYVCVVLAAIWCVENWLRGYWRIVGWWGVANLTFLGMYTVTTLLERYLPL